MPRTTFHTSEQNLHLMYCKLPGAIMHPQPIMILSGFQVARPVLERAFFQTYGLKVTELFGNFSRAIGTFRWLVKGIFPEITKAAWATKKDEIQKLTPTATSRTFIYRMRRR